METTTNSGEIPTEFQMRRFYLRRDTDESGVSGQGIVAEGVELSSGKVILTFRSHLGSVQILDRVKVRKSTSDHKGATKIVWIDPEPFESEEQEENESTENN